MRTKEGLSAVAIASAVLRATLSRKHCTIKHMQFFHLLHYTPHCNTLNSKQQYLIHHHHHQSVLPNCRCFTANSGTKAAVLSECRCSTANSGTKVAVLLGITRCGSFPHPTLPLPSEQTWKDPRSPTVEVRRLDLANWALLPSQKFTTEG